jgi:hypothetical protein
MHEESQIGKAMSATSTSMNQINQNSNWHFKCLLLTQNKQLVFYLITCMVLRASSYGSTLNAWIVTYDYPDYGVYISTPTKKQVLQCVFCNYMHLYFLIVTLKWNATNIFVMLGDVVVDYL